MDPYSSGYGQGPYPSKPPSEGKAVLAFVLGLVSFFMCGLTGIPAIVLGFSARADIARSEGMKGGQGLATAGIVTGFLGTAMTLASVGVLLVSAVLGGTGAFHTSASGHAGPPPLLHSPGGSGSPAPVAPSAASSEPGPTPLVDGKIGGIRVFDLDPDAKASFHEQLANEVTRARAAKKTPLVMTSARWCSVCREFETAMSDPRMQAALAKVSLVRVDIEAWGDELRERGMLEPTLPWFYKLDASLRPSDAISAGEWDDNVPANMAPVLQAFLGGTLRARRNPSSLGTSL